MKLIYGESKNCNETNHPSKARLVNDGLCVV
jgi:hypothetical protein